MDEYDSVVVGAGAVGLCCALNLQARGHKVALVEARGPGTQASHGNAGVIGRSSILPIASPALRASLLRYALHRDPAVRLDWSYLPRVLPWLRRLIARANPRDYRAAAKALAPFTTSGWDEHMRLAQRTGAGELYRRTGWISGYRSEAAFAAAAGDRAIIREEGIEIRELGPADLRDLEPGLRPVFVRGLFVPETGSVAAPGEVCRRFAETFRADGGRLVADTAVDVAERDSGSIVTLAGGTTVRAKAVVLAVGAWAREGLVRRLGYRMPMASERGYHMEFARTDRAPSRPVLDVERRYVMTPMLNGVRITSGSEIAAIGAPRRPVQLGLCVAAARELVDLGEPALPEPWMGSRPATPDSMPVVGRAPRHRALWFAFGHGHIGFGTSAITGRLIADLVTGETPPFDVTPFAPDRLL